MLLKIQLNNLILKILIGILRIHKDGGDLTFFYIQPFEPRPCQYNSKEFYTKSRLEKLIYI